MNYQPSQPYEEERNRFRPLLVKIFLLLAVIAIVLSGYYFFPKSKQLCMEYSGTCYEFHCERGFAYVTHNGGTVRCLLFGDAKIVGEEKKAN